MRIWKINEKKINEEKINFEIQLSEQKAENNDLELLKVVF